MSDEIDCPNCGALIFLSIERTILGTVDPHAEIVGWETPADRSNSDA